MVRRRVAHPKHRTSFCPKYRRSRRKAGRDLAFVQIDGRRIYLGAYGTADSRERYHRLLAEWVANGRHLPVAADDITVTEVAALCLRWARGYYVKRGKRTAEP
jgi:hypothetical protein